MKLKLRILAKKRENLKNPQKIWNQDVHLVTKSSTYILNSLGTNQSICIFYGSSSFVSM
jgi:hypothetical protein